jgi:hypothetical protein
VRRFTLLDEPYYSALVRVTRALAESGLPFCLVGGGAAQAWIAHLRTGGGAQRLSEQPALESALRATRDLDFATRTDAGTMLRTLNELAVASGAGSHVLSPHALRLGLVSIAFTIEPDDLAGMADQYDRFLESRGPLRLRRGEQGDEIPTIGLAELVATKLSRRGDKAKDILDVAQIVEALADAGLALDLDRVRALVAGRPEALVLLDEISRRSAGR